MSLIDNRPAQWDIEMDVVAVGSGIGGLSAAITASELGATTIVLEKSDQVGGVTALSMGEVWVAGNHHAAAIGIEDSPDSGFRYLQRLAMDYGSDVAIMNKVVHAREALKYFEDRIGLRMQPIRDCPDYYYGLTNDSVSEGRMLECEPFPAETLGDWQSKTRISPSMPYQMTHHDIFSAGGVANMAKWDFELMAKRIENDERCLGPALAAYFVKGALDRKIPLLTETSVEELISDGNRVVGVRALRAGREVFVKANKGVVVAVSSYERNEELSKTVGQQLDLGSIVIATVDGSNFRLMGSLGAKIARVPDITALGFVVPGEDDENGRPIWRSALQTIGQPHTIVVNRAGKRFGNEAFYRSFYYTIDHIDGATQTHPNFPCWAIIDSQARAKYPFGSVVPGQDWPTGFGVVADTLEELARKVGIDAAALQATVAAFNVNALAGEDPEFGRGRQPWSNWMCGDPFQKPSAVLGTLSEGPFYAVELHRLGGSAIPAAGVMTDIHSRVVDWRSDPIPGLYAAGNSVARMETGAVMQSGISNARGMTHGWLAAHHACGEPSTRLAGERRHLQTAF